MHNEDKYLSTIAAVLFISAFVFNLTGAIVGAGRVENVCWEIGSLAAVGGYAVMAGKLNRERRDLIAAGFSILIVAEGFAISTVANPDRLDDASFGACMALYIPGFLIVGLFSHFKWWTRLACILLSIPFGIEAFHVLNGIKIDYNNVIQISGYFLQSFAFVGWSVELLKRPKL